MNELLKVFMGSGGLWFALTAVVLWHSRKHWNTFLKNVSDRKIIFRAGKDGVVVEPAKIDKDKGVINFAVVRSDEVLPSIPQDANIVTDGCYYLVHRADIANRDSRGIQWYNITVKVETDSNGLYEKIEHVVYQLHESFSNRYIKKSNREKGFLLEINVWGEFNIQALLTLKDGSVIQCFRYLDLPGRPPY